MSRLTIVSVLKLKSKTQNYHFNLHVAVWYNRIDSTFVVVGDPHHTLLHRNVDQLKRVTPALSSLLH